MTAATARPSRSLVLSGGGIRVAYQAGAIRALFDAGLTFDHVDATSGGGLNLAMLLSGLSPAEMCERWRTLDPKRFLSFMPLEKYLNAADLTAMGGADGIASGVIPHLGIDFATIRGNRTLAGTFNVCNFTRKANEVVPHGAVDRDVLIAGMSLPGVLPPVKRGSDWYLDSAFIRDANPLEAVHRGADEVWIIWCLGNTPSYKGGFLNVYIQMIEMAAHGALHQDFERIRELNERVAHGEAPGGRMQPVVVHLVLPEYRLPLDLDLVTGRIGIATLIDMGYADASRYLAGRRPEGVPLTPEVTMMKEGALGLMFRETMSGPFALGVTDPQEGARQGRSAGTELAMHATITIRDLTAFIADREHAGEIVGRITFPPLGRDLPASSGRFNLFSPSDDPKLKRMVYELAFEHGGESYYLAGRKDVKDDPGFDLWKDTTTLLTRLHKGPDASGPVVGAGVLSLSPTELVKLLSTAHALNASSVAEEAKAVAAFGRFFLGELWNSYISKVTG